MTPPTHFEGDGLPGLTTNSNKMVTITQYLKKTNEQGKDFFALVLIGELEIIQSKEKGNMYATARRCTIPSTFEEEFCKGLVGKKLPGVIEKVACENYEYVIPESGATVQLGWQYRYNPNPSSIEEKVFDDLVVVGNGTISE
jgi:hypothetical protein